jgi:hypothetical protein
MLTQTREKDVFQVPNSRAAPMAGLSYLMALTINPTILLIICMYRRLDIMYFG